MLQTPVPVLDAEWLRRLCLEAGADDVGFVPVATPALADQAKEIDRLLPGARMLISIVCRMSRGNIRTPFRSIANLEFHHTSDHTNATALKIVAALEKAGIEAACGVTGFPMEADRWGAKMWVISHKPVAEAAGLGRMGIHRNVIHPKFGNFILLETIAVAAEIESWSKPIDYDPCVECKLCVAACPTGAIGPDGQFNFSACYTHNYREFMGGFSNWVETIADSRDAKEYRERVNAAETVSMWQSLSFGANYKAAYCMAVCPAGEEVISPFLADRRAYTDRLVKPLRDKEETIYAVPGSDAVEYVARHFPNKRVKLVRNGLGPASIRALLRALPLVFQRGRAKGLSATYHFSFTGAEQVDATITIAGQELRIEDGHHGKPDLRVSADSTTWLRFIRKEAKLPWALLTRKVKLTGNPKLLLAFGKCFPG